MQENFKISPKQLQKLLELNQLVEMLAVTGPTSIVLTLEILHTSPSWAAGFSLWQEHNKPSVRASCTGLCGFISKANFTQLQTDVQFTSRYFLPPNIPIIGK